jgi:chromosome segregation protein
LRFTRLRVSGFKSFVEPVELRIEPGLTGVVGPNGCGKSNVIESLRWVMGAASAKAMRAGGMDDVIFAGTESRPARNQAEVQLTIDNSDRRAPAELNDADILEVSRRITRGAGSLYRVNGREARARDVQRLFADASSGANSPALVRQGQISELINAKPENRRRVLEEAAGVAGLRSRRHEAELKLNAAHENLTRLEDVLAGEERELDHLRRQARQAKRYIKVAAEVRALQAALASRRVADARAKESAAATALADANASVEARAEEAAAARDRAAAADAALRPAREAETKAAAALAQAAAALDAAQRELAQIRQETTRAEADRRRTGDERARETALLADAEAAVARLESESEALAQAANGPSTEDLVRARTGADKALAQAQAARDALTRDAAAATAQARALELRLGRIHAAIPRLEAELGKLGDAGAAAAPSPAETEAARAAAAAAEAALLQAREAANRASEAADAARAAEREAFDAHAKADRAFAALDAEVAALERALADDMGRAPALDVITVAPGYERAVSVAFGDDLLASLDPDAPARWTGADVPAQTLPEGAEPLAGQVQAPSVLRPRLSQIGVVASEADGARLAPALAPGQRLVTREGALWRWDGFHLDAGAASSAERRLAARGAHEAAVAHREAAAKARADAEARRTMAQAAAREALAGRDSSRDAPRKAEIEARTTRERLVELERRAARADAAASAAQKARVPLETQLAEERGALAEAEAEQAALVSPDRDALAQADAALEDARAQAANARAALHSAERAVAERRARTASIRGEDEAWRSRGASAAARLASLDQRAAELDARLTELAAAPDALTARLEALGKDKALADGARRQSTEALAQAETEAQDASSALKTAETALSAAREARAGAEVRRGALEERRAEAEAALVTAPAERPEDLPETDRLSLEELETLLEKKTAERDRIGPVNLQAAEEADQRDAALASTRTQRDDLIAAVTKLRGAVRALDSEARERLRQAFNVIDGHFRDLFQTLFNGGEARLALVDDEDPLVAGLEIFVSPPGKKLGSLSLMSGGEQALTATALIFAVFLANPAPICALDEVDAPLDDANVGRFCDLLDAMRKKSDTRFLVITHNAVTMSRMDRLYGVTMAERGVSQLVSVDLAVAEELAEAS